MRTYTTFLMSPLRSLRIPCQQFAHRFSGVSADSRRQPPIDSNSESDFVKNSEITMLPTLAQTTHKVADGVQKTRDHAYHTQTDGRKNKTRDEGGTHACIEQCEKDGRASTIPKFTLTIHKIRKQNVIAHDMRSDIVMFFNASYNPMCVAARSSSTLIVCLAFCAIKETTSS